MSSDSDIKKKVYVDAMELFFFIAYFSFHSIGWACRKKIKSYEMLFLRISVLYSVAKLFRNKSKAYYFFGKAFFLKERVF